MQFRIEDVGRGQLIAFGITKEEIERLDPLSLTKLMKRLLRTEMSKLKLKQSELVVSLDINDPDEGLDGYIGCEIPQDHPWLPSGKSGWQFKAVRDFPRSKIEEEVLNSDKTDVKPRIKKLLEEGETYVLVIGRKDYNPTQVAEKEGEIREVFESKDFSEGKVKLYSSGQIADWANSLQSVAAYLRPDRASFKNIEEWQEKTRVIKEPREFVPDAKREEMMKSIRAAVISNHNGERATIIRLVGFQGVGKTRLIYEVLNIEQLKELVLYSESPEKLPVSRFNEVAGNEEISAIFVIDECPHDDYVQLAKEVEGIGGRMTLITLDYHKDKPRDPKDIHIVLEPLDNGASDRLVRLTVPSLPDIARRKIVEFSEGFPKIAVLLSRNFSTHPDILSPGTLSRIGISDLFDRIIAGRHSQASVISRIKGVLTMIALVKRLGWDDDVATQGRSLCELFGIDWMEARTIVKEQEDKGLVVKRGRYRYVTPLPLAIYLASSWWKAMDESSWTEFFKKLPDQETRMAFLDRLGDLPHSEHTEIALKNILSGFKYETLDNPHGSEIFLGLATADHLSAMETLERVLGPLSRERLLEFKAGRRNVVWALEKIAWWEDTFQRAAKMLMKLADAENETWSNNATGIFTRLFQTFLGGTTVPAWDRHSILEEAVLSGKRTLQGLALKGLNAALSLRHATRSVSAEEQGTTIPPPEWNPASSEDVRKTVLSALNILDEAVRLRDPELQTGATKIFLSHVRILFALGFKDEVLERLQSTRTQFPGLEKELIKTVESVIHYDSKKLDVGTINAVKSFREELVGNDFSGLMKRYVKNRLLEDQLAENREKVEKILRELADEIKESPEKLEGELSWLVTDEAENGYAFGQILGESDRENHWLGKILQATKEAEHPSVSFLGGYLSSIKSRNQHLWERVLYRCYSDETLRRGLLEIIWRSGASDEAVRFVIEMLKNQDIEPQEIRLLTYGAWFCKVSMKRFVEFLEEYYKIEDGKHAPIILGIIQQYVDANPEIVSSAKDLILKYITRPEIFHREQDEMALYYWDGLSDKIMKRFSDTIPQFLDLILNTLTERDHMALEPHIRKKLEYFLREDLEHTWKKINRALVGRDIRAWRLMQILKGDYPNFRHEKSSLLYLIPECRIWEWVEENPDEAPFILARMIPLHESEPLLHPLARSLLAKHSDNEKVAAELSANWHTEAWAGARSLHFEHKLHIAEDWAKDSETAVAKWASREAESLKRQIENARRREEERGL